MKQWVVILSLVTLTGKVDMKKAQSLGIKGKQVGELLNCGEIQINDKLIKVGGYFGINLFHFRALKTNWASRFFF